MANWKLTHNGTDYTVLDDDDYGGVFFESASSGKKGIFQVTLANYSGELLDASKENGCKIQEVDEITISLNVSGAWILMFTGVVKNVAFPIKPEGREVVTLTGEDFLSFWGDGRVHEKDYSRNPTADKDAIINALADIHPSLNTANVQGNGKTIEKNFVGTKGIDVIREICKEAGLDFYAQGKIIHTFPADGGAVANIITETQLDGDANLKFSAENSNYDEVYFTSNVPATAPDKGYYTDNLVNVWLPDSVFLPDQTDDVTKRLKNGKLFAGTYNTADCSSRTVGLIVKIRPPLINEDDIFTSLDLKETDWETVEFMVLNQFTNLDEFKVRLYERTTGYYWESPNLKQILIDHINEVVSFELLLPSTIASVDPAYWTVNGAPATIEELQFRFFAPVGQVLSSNFEKSVLIGAVKFHSVLRKRAIKANARAHRRQKLIVDRSITNTQDADNLVKSEIAKYGKSTLIGHLVIEGDLAFTFCGLKCEINLSHFNPKLNGYLARIERIRHEQKSGLYQTTVWFAPSAIDALSYMP